MCFVCWRVTWHCLFSSQVLNRKGFIKLALKHGWVELQMGCLEVCIYHNLLILCIFLHVFIQGSTSPSLFLWRKRAVWPNGKSQRFSAQEAAGGTSPQLSQMYCVQSHCAILYFGSSPTEPAAEHNGSSTTSVPRPWSFPVQLWSDSLQETYQHSRYDELSANFVNSRHELALR